MALPDLNITQTGHFNSYSLSISLPFFLTICRRLRHIDTHLSYVCTMPYTYSGKNIYAEPVINKTKHISKSGINMSTFFE